MSSEFVVITEAASDVVEVVNSSTNIVEVLQGSSSTGPRGEKGEKGDSITAGVGSPSTIIPGVSVFIDAVSGDIYIYEED